MAVVFSAELRRDDLLKTFVCLGLKIWNMVQYSGNKLMIFCHGMNDRLLNTKICKQETKGWEETKALVRKYAATQTLQTGLEKKKADKGHVVNSLTSLRKP